MRAINSDAFFSVFGMLGTGTVTPNGREHRGLIDGCGMLVALSLSGVDDMNTLNSSVENPGSAKDGMTLIEVLVASAILLTVLGASFAAVLQARYLARVVANRTHAIQIARSNLETLREEMGYNDSALTTGVVHTNMPSELPQIYSVDSQVVYVDYEPSYTVTKTDLGYGVSYKTVNFTVTWNESIFRNTVQHSVNADTVISSALNR